jgi:hypothetical protein
VFGIILILGKIAGNEIFKHEIAFFSTSCILLSKKKLLKA